jgi:hypothetical protein
MTSSPELERRSGGVSIPGSIGSVGDIVGGNKVEIRAGPDTPVPVPGEQAPADYVERPEVTDGLLAFLLSEDATPRGRAVISAVHGLGGMGKTTVARWLVWQSEVGQRFADGRIWVTLGNEPPDALTVLNEVASKFDPTLKAKTTQQAAKSDLAAVLQQRSVLLVIDDVWPGESFEVATALLVPSPRSRFLLTTRFPQLAAAPEVRAANFPLDEMSEAQASALVSRVLGRPLSDAELLLARQLCGRVGGHPLALELAAARVREGRAWRQLLSDLALEIARLDGLDKLEDPLTLLDEAKRKRRSVKGSLLLSIRYLNARGRELFILLSVAAEDAVINAAMAATLWSVDKETADRHLWALSGSGLLRAVDGGYQIHDLMHAIARDLLAAPAVPARDGDLPGLGLTLQSATAQFLVRHKARLMNGLWHTMPDDGYIHEHLVPHLGAAGWTEELEALLWEECASGLCGWYQARESLGQIAGFLADVRRIWDHAERMLNNAPPDEGRARAVSLQLHCALITSSINSLSAAIPSQVLAGAVRYGIASRPAALALARQHPDTAFRAFALLGLVAEMSPADQPKLFDEANAIARSLRGDLAGDWQDAMAKAIRELPTEQALALASNLLRVSNGRLILEDVERRRSEEATVRPTAEQRLDVVRDIRDPLRRARELAHIAEQLPAQAQAGVLEEAIQATLIETQLWYGSKDLAITVAEIARQLPEDRRRRVFEQALTAAHKISDAQSRAEALAAVAQRQPAEMRHLAFGKAIEAARHVDGTVRRITVLAEVTRLLPAGMQPAALGETVALSQSIKEPERRAEALSSVIRRLPSDMRPDLVDMVVEASRGIADPRQRACVLMEGAQQTSDRTQRLLAERAWAAARDIKDTEEQVQALLRIARRIPAEARSDTLDNALEIARQLELPGKRAQIVGELGRQLPAEQALALVRDIEDPRARAVALARVVRRLPADEAMAAVRQIAFRYRSGLLALVTRRLPAERVLAIAPEIDDGAERARTLARIVRRLKSSTQPHAISQALRAASTIKEPLLKAQTLAYVAGRLPLEFRPGVFDEALLALRSSRWLPWGFLRRLPAEQALAAARDIAKPWPRAEALARVTARLPAKSRPSVLGEALDAGRKINTPFVKARVLTGIARRLPAGARTSVLEEALIAARGIEESPSRAHALAAVAQQLSATQPRVIGEVLEATRSAPFPDQIWVVERVASCLPLAQVTELARTLRTRSGDGFYFSHLMSTARRLPRERALAFARGLSGVERACAIIEAARRLPVAEREGPLNEVLAALRWSGDQHERLLHVARRLPAEVPEGFLWQVFEAARALEDPEARDRVLVELARRLPADKALALTPDIGNTWQRARVLTVLVDRIEARSRPSCFGHTLGEAIRVISHQDRRRCISGLVSSIPLIATMGGNPSIQGLARSIFCVGRWWP